MKPSGGNGPVKCVRRKSNGEPCQAWAMKGTTLCRKHGGNASQIQRARVRRDALSKAQRMVDLAGLEMDPITHLLDSLYRQDALMRAYGMLVAELQDHGLTETNRLGDSKLHPFVVAYEQAVRERGKLAKLCMDAKVGERQMQLAERAGEQLSLMFERVIGAIRGLTAAQRVQGIKALAAEAAQLERPVIDGTARDVAA